MVRRPLPASALEPMSRSSSISSFQRLDPDVAGIFASVDLAEFRRGVENVGFEIEREDADTARFLRSAQPRFGVAQRLRRQVFFRAVAQNLDQADRRSILVADGADLAIGPETFAGFAKMPPVVVGVARPVAAAIASLALSASRSSGVKKQLPMLASDLFFGPAEDAASAFVPAQDDPIQIESKNGVIDMPSMI